MSFLHNQIMMRLKFRIFSAFTHWQLRCRILFSDCLNAFIYTPDGATKMRKISIDGMNEMKYALRYNHSFSEAFTQPGSNEMMRRGIDKTSKIIGLMINCLFPLNCFRTCWLKVWSIRVTDRCRAVPKKMNKAEKRLARNGRIRWKKRMVVL